MMEDRELIEMNIADTIIQRPIGFNVDSESFFIYPPTLGLTYLLARLLKNLCANENIIAANPYLEALRLCADKKDTVCRILSYHTFCKKEDIFNNSEVEKRAKVFEFKLDTEELATLFTLILSGDNTELYVNYFGIDKERQERARISKVKSEGGNSISFGGNSAYGTLIDFACQRYGWTMDYVVWGISYSNLKMLMADSITTIYLSEDERKKLGVNVGEVINADDPKNKSLIKEMIHD